MRVIVRIPAGMRSATNGRPLVASDGSQLRDVLTGLARQYPALAGQILDESGEILRHVKVYVGEDDSQTLDGLDTAIPAGLEVAIISGAAGGVSSCRSC